MKLNDQILQRLAEWRPSEGRTCIAIVGEEPGWTATITADRNDELGCMMWESVVQKTTARGALSLRAWADHVAQHVTCLFGPLKVVEVDETRQEALLRSAKPTQRGPVAYYYEVMLAGTHTATLRRFQTPRDVTGAREQLAAPLTHEILAQALSCMAVE